MQIGFELKGLASMLQHQDNIEMSDLLQRWRKDPKNKGISTPGDDRSPAWSWHSCLYDDGKHIAIPSEMIMSALKKAGTDMVMKKQKTFKAVSQSGMMTSTEFLEFKTDGKKVAMKDIHALRDLDFQEQADGVRDLGFRLFVKRANVERKKHIRVRPRFDSWSVRGEMLVIAPELTFDVVKQMFDIAGRLVGIGDWRPGAPKSPGPFGVFEATLKKLD